MEFKINPPVYGVYKEVKTSKGATIKISRELKDKLDSYYERGDTYDKILKILLSQREAMHKTIGILRTELDTSEDELYDKIHKLEKENDRLRKKLNSHAQNSLGSGNNANALSMRKDKKISFNI